MKHQLALRCAISSIVIFAATSVKAAPPVVNPEGIDVGADINAKIGMEKARRNSTTSAMQKGAGSNASDNCGSVNINSNDTKSNSGVKSMLSKPTTTIVTGPVINMANCK